jgi:hypothetical protein
VHYNLTLVRADSPEEAYSKALVFGKHHESSYTNPDGKHVQAVFRGLRNLFVIYDELEDGAEILYEEQTGLSEEQITSMIPGKDALAVFLSLETARMNTFLHVAAKTPLLEVCATG